MGDSLCGRSLRATAAYGTVRAESLPAIARLVSSPVRPKVSGRGATSVGAEKVALERIATGIFPRLLTLMLFG